MIVSVNLAFMHFAFVGQSEDLKKKRLTRPRYVAQGFQEGDLEISDSGLGCCWDRYDLQEPEIGNENITSLKITLDASKEYILRIYQEAYVLYINFLYELIKGNMAYRKCNGYRRRKWTRRHEFKSWTRLIAFHIALIPLGKIWIQLFSLQLWVNSRAD